MENNLENNQFANIPKLYQPKIEKNDSFLI
jgi:hypothetical protein